MLLQLFLAIQQLNNASLRPGDTNNGYMVSIPFVLVLPYRAEETLHQLSFSYFWTQRPFKAFTASKAT